MKQMPKYSLKIGYNDNFLKVKGHLQGMGHNDPQIAEGGAFYHQCLIKKLNLI